MSTYLSSCPLKNSLYRLFSVIQSASVDFSILRWNSVVHSSLPLSLHPSHMPPPCWRTHYIDQLSVSLITLHWSTHYSVFVPHVCFSHSALLYILMSVCVMTHTYTLHRNVCSQFDTKNKSLFCSYHSLKLTLTQYILIFRTHTI